MTKSIIAKDYRTTVPSEVREKLGVGPSDALRWEIVGNTVRVTAERPEFFKHKGTIKVGSGSAVEDVKKARSLRGADGR